ncbi:MAG: UDP-N-acetylglucosamine 1-carboxyvinyltransferase [Christensenellales bacterium]|jgi:UDP-N-acetylglucosamine 1-carboxyvinyltransferase
MAKLMIQGGNALSGETMIPAAKNSILPILAACLLAEKPVVIENCPDYLDARNMVSILSMLGCKTQQEGRRLTVDAHSASKWEMPETLAKELRSSIFMLGPVVGRFKKAKFTYPGGCEIGQRPIDMHLKGLRELNVEIIEEHGYIYCRGDNLKGADVHLDYPSVGATENVMMAAVLAKGQTIIHNAAREPEIKDLQDFLNAIGANICGAGSSTIRIVGVRSLGGAVYSIIPDRIVAGTVMVAAAITGGDIYMRNVRQEHIQAITSKLGDCGCEIYFEKDAARVIGPRRPREIQLLETLPYPGFPTDMQAQMFALCTVADGTSVVVENVFDNRFKHAVELCKMGAKVTVKDRMAIIRGVETLAGADVAARDLRGGAALVLAGLRARGLTVVNNAEIIGRGYEDLAAMLGALGADIIRA